MSSVDQDDVRSSIKHKDVEIALRVDHGSNALLKSFKFRDFAKKGENYASVVTIVDIEYELSGQTCETSIVAKLNPQTGDEGFGSMTNLMFKKEIYFYENIKPIMDEELNKLGMEDLRLPKFYHAVHDSKKEVMYMQDMRRLGYKMCDRNKGMDYAHTNMIMKELGRFHASSVLFLSREEMRNADYSQILSFTETFDAMAPNQSDMGDSVRRSTSLIDSFQGYGYVSDFIKAKGKYLDEEFRDQLTKYEDSFKVIGHGDCWINNFLFR